MYQTERWFSPDIESTGASILDISASRTQNTLFCLLATSLWRFLPQPRWTEMQTGLMTAIWQSTCRTSALCSGYMCLIKYTVGNPSTKCDGIYVRPWEVSRPWKGAIVNDIKCLTTQTQEKFLTLCHWMSQWEASCLYTKTRVCIIFQSLSALIVGFHSLKLWEINVCCLEQLVYGVLL